MSMVCVLSFNSWKFGIIRIYSSCSLSAVYLAWSVFFFCLKIKVIPLYASLWGTRRSCTSLVGRTTLWPWPRSDRNPCICGVINDIEPLNVTKRLEHVDINVLLFTGRWCFLIWGRGLWAVGTQLYSERDLT